MLRKVFKREIAMKLRDMGNPIMDAYPNLKNSKFVVYAFEDTDKFNKDLAKIQLELNK